MVMHRTTIKCANCGNQDLEVTVNYCIPRGIYLECPRMGCGWITPIAFFDARGEAYGVNGIATQQAFNDSYCEDISPKKAREAVYTDLGGKQVG